MAFTVIIPARFASQRLAGKPLVHIQGKTMIERVYRQACKSEAEQVVVATDHPDIEREVQGFGGAVCMTREDHASGTDRLAEVVNQLGLADDALVVNVQGDEPLIPPQVINQVAENLAKNSDVSVATVSEAVVDIATYLNPNAVKVVADNQQRALYFSRATMPWNRDLLADVEAHEAQLAAFLEQGSVQKHIGIYAYRVDLLKAFVTWPEAALETIEKLEQLRIMANGKRIHVEAACAPVPGGIDTMEDLLALRAILAKAGK